MSIIISGGSGSGATATNGTTLLQARQYTAKELGPWLASTAAGSSSTTQLVDTSWPVNSTLDQASLFQDQILFRPNAAAAGDKSRIVKQYTPSGGVLVPDTTWTNAPAAAEAYELHGRIDPLVVHSAINEALKELMVEVEFTIAPIAQNNRHNVSASQPWCINPAWIRQVGFLKLVDVRDQLDPYKFRVIRGDAVKRNGQVYIEHPYIAFDPSTDVIYVKAISPAYYQCSASGGSFGSQSGLSLDTDIAPVSVDWLASATLVLLWRRYSQILEPAANGRLINDLQTAVAWKSELTDRDLVIPELTFLPLPQRWGPIQHGGLGILDWNG
jgi:hypothetical protein